MDVLRIVTAGSVDDGKSTLIGRLLLECGALPTDEIEAVRRDSLRRGQQGLDLSLFTDGLRDEREQKITIDVAYRYFSTARRKFIIADCPGHPQYTRNLVTGASTSELAVIMVDARHGLVAQSKRHAFLSTLLGLPHLVVAVNKMDLVEYKEEVYLRLCDSFTRFAAKLEVGSLTFLPLSALHGDNVVERSERMPWYEGGTLLHHLETVNAGATANVVDFRFPVQMVIRPHQDYRGYAGRVASGRIAVGEEVVVLPAGVVSQVSAIDVYQDSRPQASAGEAVVLRLADPVDAARGSLIVRRNNLPDSADTLDATLCWLHSAPLQLDRGYTLLHGTRKLSARVSALDYRIDVNTMHREAAPTLRLNDIGRARLSVSQPLFFDPYRRNRQTGAFLLVDPVTHDTLAAGMIRGRARGLARPAPPREGRERPAGHQPAVVWLTGLSGAGKSTLAGELERRLIERGVRTFTIDGDALRQGLCADLGFSPQERAENIRRAAHLAQLAWSQGQLAICSLISPYAADRALARGLISPGQFFEVHLACPLETCQARDPKGLYARARRGEIPEFTGLSAPYEVPSHPDLRLDTATLSVQQALDLLVAMLETAGILPSPGEDGP